MNTLTGLKKLGIDLEVSNTFSRLLAETGFETIGVETFAGSLNGWPRDPKWKAMGKGCLQNYMNGVQGFSVTFFTRELGWAPARVQTVVEKTKMQAMDPKSHVSNTCRFRFAEYGSM